MTPFYCMNWFNLSKYFNIYIKKIASLKGSALNRGGELTLRVSP